MPSAPLRFAVAACLLFVIPTTLAAQDDAKPSAASAALPPLPDSAGWGIHVLAAARDPGGTIWLGTYGHGLFRLPPAATTWDVIRHDSSATSLSWDFVHALAFGPRGETWYGTVGNGWGLSTDGGRTWRNWGAAELGSEWEYVSPAGIATRGDTTVIATADGLQLDDRRWRSLARRRGLGRRPVTRSGRHGARPSRERVRAPGRAGQPRMADLDAAGQPAAATQRHPVGNTARRRGSLQLRQCDSDRAAAVSGARPAASGPRSIPCHASAEPPRPARLPARRSRPGSAGRFPRPTTPPSTRPTATGRRWAEISSSIRASSLTIRRERRCSPSGREPWSMPAGRSRAR